MKYNFIIVLIFIGITVNFISCNTVKYVPENENLLVKNSIYINGKKNIDNEINDYIVQRPNQLVLGVPLPLYFYNLANEKFESDFEKWKIESPNWYNFTTKVFSEKQAIGLRNFKFNTHQWILKNGEAPVIFSSKKALMTSENLLQHYFNEGFYKAKVVFEDRELKNQKVAVDYFIETDQQYFIDTVSVSIESKVIDSIYNNHKSNSFIKNGDLFKIELFVKEQERLSTLFRNSGIYRFNKNAINFEADSSFTKYKSNVLLLINDSITNLPYKVQKIRNVKIYTDYTYNTRDEPIKDSLNYEGYTFLAQDKIQFNPKLLLNSIFIEPNSVYMDETRELTRKQLRGLKNFRTVDIKYNEFENDDLEASILLSPLKKYGLGFNTELTHSNIRQLGISGKLSFLNRNIFKGAEILKFSIQGSFLDSKDAADSEKLLNAWEIGADVSIELPRFLLPFESEGIVPKYYSPRTTFTLGTSLQKNIGLDKQKFTGIVDYTWETSDIKSHSFQLLNAQYIKNLNIGSYFSIYTSEYNDLKDIQQTYFPTISLSRDNAIDFLRTNINSNFQQTNPEEYQAAKNIETRYNIITEDVFIPSMEYSFTINNAENYKDTEFSFFRVRFVSTGNVSTILAKQEDSNGNKTLLNTPIAQYIRTDLEYKKFWTVHFDNVLAFRSFLGIAIPYGNSKTIPFNRSYFIGGSNDLRAWKIYDLGPGSTKSGLEYNVGNLKFISSLEYRFKVLNSIKGALFIDAGNIWDITNLDVTDSDAKFNGLNSIKDIAVGTGFGIRYDLSFILLRLDIGFKTYEPYFNGNSKWFQNYNFKNNVYNFGISYPF
ncbi:BamA/TamA family outer membrane protein [Lutibacter sp.]|uniref:translocation and assembly module lipoprotein TamL n=1 Tax=Lutibacter sp. TaxID=1925666 RepID=UPI002736FF72|nr:BamA/TamA family outer membrane protein [Lutibacter sp.]MDP3311749.1 BamA/TamA family outer membrane protein [Lutibacter sp.]